MWAAAVVDIGLSPEAFWDLTPRHFGALFDQHLAREDRANRRAAMIAWAVASYAGKQLPEGVKLTLDDFLGQAATGSATQPHYEEAPKWKTPEQWLDELRSADPLAEVTHSFANIEMVAAGRGQWSKLGTREGLTQPLNVALVMAGKKPK